MSFDYPLHPDIDLHVTGRIGANDAARQTRTAAEILRRLATQPGLILADEVGMGKTFVSLAVAVSVSLADKRRRPVVVMVPPSLREKWPRDAALFAERCLPAALRERVRFGTANRAEQFLKFLDDPVERRKSVLFVTHGAMHRGLSDGWIKLALIWRALKQRKHAENTRCVVARCAGELLGMKWAERVREDIWEKLLHHPPEEWLQILQDCKVDPEGDHNPETDDDPVPEAILDILPELETDSLYECLKQLPVRRTKHFEWHIDNARRAINDQLREIWRHILARMRLRLPLLILDEAHHLKNARTRLASLFQDEDASQDSHELTRGALAGVFQRMLFLTATPFQLGHAELCSVLERFAGIAWSGAGTPLEDRAAFSRTIEALRDALDAGQEAALTLDSAWGRLRPDDLAASGQLYSDVAAWWPSAAAGDGLSPAGTEVIQCFERARTRLRAAENLLRPWVIRHLRPRRLPHPYEAVSRRQITAGADPEVPLSDHDTRGLELDPGALLPFLLAARAAAQAPDARPVFAEGLASSYEAFLHTRRAHGQSSGDGAGGLSDADDDPIDLGAQPASAAWYLDLLEGLVAEGTARRAASHPKIAATVHRVLQVWLRGEKTVVFCHFVATGRALRQRISEAVAAEIRRAAAARLRCAESEAMDELERIGERFFDEDSPLRRECRRRVQAWVDRHPALRDHSAQIEEIVRRNVRTPSFLVRFFPLRPGRLTEAEMARAFAATDLSGLTLERLLAHFLIFLAERCGADERQAYLDALARVQTGSHAGQDIDAAYSEDELQGVPRERLLPNVRLVNGGTASDTRQRLMLAFNTPFYPEVLVASSVMAEGVDLHLNCRNVIHHDLSWNPSTLEQRTGRVDRIGAKAELCGRSIQIYLPFIAETQDEKQFRVVLDRERWFKVVMGEKYKLDLRTTDRLAARLPIPAQLADDLVFRLDVENGSSNPEFLKREDCG